MERRCSFWNLSPQDRSAIDLRTRRPAAHHCCRNTAGPNPARPAPDRHHADPRISNGWVAFSARETEVTTSSSPGKAIVPGASSGSKGMNSTSPVPTFSPDGSKLAYIETDRTGLAPGQLGGGVGEVVVVEFDDGAVPLELFRGRGATWRGCPTWSPDSTRVAYVFDNLIGNES